MVSEEVFYDTSLVPLSDRESFNNTILLLTLVKSKYYYIIGFSRPDERITIGFDFMSKTEGTHTKELTVDFGSSKDDIIMFCDVVQKTEISNEKLSIIATQYEHLLTNNDMVRYERRIKKDSILPSSVNAMNRYLLSARHEIEIFLQASY